ncbi:hypothetical protein [Pelomonas cellulosilytica]|nr:hypothetical protein [Pelomonas sp. P8]
MSKLFQTPDIQVAAQAASKPPPQAWRTSSRRDGVPRNDNGVPHD